MDAVTFTATIRENTFDPDDAEVGGRAVVHVDDTEARKAGLHQCELIINAADDRIISELPRTKAEKTARKFRVTLEEITE